MKSTSLLTLVAAAVLAACSTPAPTPTAPAPVEIAPAAPTPDANAKSMPESSVATVVIPAHKDPKNALSSERSVYFDFDDFSVKNEYGTVVEKHGKYLRGNPALAIRIEGN